MPLCVFSELRSSPYYHRTLSLARYGNFPANLLIKRPYHLTYELRDKDGENNFFSRLRVVPASELHADVVAEEGGSSRQESAVPEESILSATDGVEFSLVDQETGEVVLRSNREIIDDNARQTLTWQEIEDLKRDGSHSGQELIAKLMLSHTGMEQKTVFSMAKYKVLKEKKFLRQFTVLPVDITNYGNFWIGERDSSKVLDMREEMVGLLGCWANVHYSGVDQEAIQPEISEAEKTEKMELEDIKRPKQPTGTRYLVVDDTSGLLVGALAERMGVLYSNKPEENDEGDEKYSQGVSNGISTPNLQSQTVANEDSSTKTEEGTAHDTIKALKRGPEAEPNSNPPSKKRRLPPPVSDLRIPYSTTNTMTLVHATGQPNLTHLNHWGFDITNPNHPPHPLLNHLLTVNWLQLLDPEGDSVYNTEPASYSAEEIESWKPSRRGNYHRKRRRWARTRYVVDSARAGGFSGLVIASSMDPLSILNPLIPLLEGGAPVAIYSATVEPLAKLVDAFSTVRRSAFISQEVDIGGKSGEELERWEGTPEFPVNPALLQGVQLHTSRARKWQVLPGRTHPVMTARGGSEGYVFTAWRAKPVEGRIAARGKFQKKAKVVGGGASTAEGTPAQAGTPTFGSEV